VRSDRSGSDTSQSMQRNLRPPVFTSIKCIGLPHLEHVGDGGFLGIDAPLGLGGSAKLSVTDNYQNEPVMIGCAPFCCGLRPLTCYASTAGRLPCFLPITFGTNC
jgi:hypothetical protein